MAKRTKALKSISPDACHGAVDAGSSNTESIHPDHSRQVMRIRRIKGQLEGVEKMIAARRYCPDIIMQLRAISSAVRSLEGAVLEAHLLGCVQDAMKSKNAAEAETKVQELMELFNRS